MIISATAASKLVSVVDPRYLSGVGTLLSAAALYGFSRITVPEDPSSILASMPTGLGGQGIALGDGVNYWTQILPFIILMAFGMGLNFVPLTLVAVHHLRPQDTGIGSGVLNTMQQVGGALGLATLSTVSLHFAQTRADELAPTHQRPPHRASTRTQLGQLAALGAFTEGASMAFFVGSFMMIAASAIVWIFLDVKHEELATEARPGGRRRPLAGRISGTEVLPASHPIAPPAPKESRDRSAPDEVRRPRASARDDPRPARRQAALAPVHRRAQRVVASGAVAPARDLAPGARGGCRRVAGPLPRARLERRRRPGRRRPVGARRDPRRPRRRPRRPARPLDGSTRGGPRGRRPLGARRGRTGSLVVGPGPRLDPRRPDA